MRLIDEEKNTNRDIKIEFQEETIKKKYLIHSIVLFVAFFFKTILKQ